MVEEASRRISHRFESEMPPLDVFRMTMLMQFVASFGFYESGPRERV
jgi:hypothetical protein